MITYSVHLNSNPVLRDVRDVVLTLTTCGSRLGDFVRVSVNLTPGAALLSPEEFRERVYEPLKETLLRKPLR